MSSTRLLSLLGAVPAPAWVFITLALVWVACWAAHKLGLVYCLLLAVRAAIAPSDDPIRGERALKVIDKLTKRSKQR